MIEKSGLVLEGFRADEILLYIKIYEHMLNEEDLVHVKEYLPVRKNPNAKFNVKMDSERVKSHKLIKELGEKEE